MHKTARALALITSLSVLSACSDRPSSPPDVTDLVGTYELTQRSRDFLRTEKSFEASPQSLSRRLADRNVLLEDIPDVYINPFGESKGASVSGRGTWEIEDDGYDYGLTLSISAGGSMPRAIYHGSSILIRGRTPPYRIEMILGDPDSNEWLIYERHES
jgi:hypothetical protein